MNQQSQGISSFSPTDVLVKRKRGRPRKDDGQVQGENVPIISGSGSDSIKKNKQIVSASNANTDNMVGQVVSGVIEGSFDAGYLINVNVKVGDAETQMRGVVFLPGRFTPITASNDVAPNTRMYKRKEIPIPVQNSQTQHHTIVPPSEQVKKQATESEIDAPKTSDQVIHSELQSSIPIAGENQSASVILPLADNLPINETDISLGEKSGLQQMSKTQSGLESQTASIIEQFKQDKVVEEDKQQRGTNMNIDASKESDPMDTPCVDIMPFTKRANHEPQVQQRTLNSDVKINDLVRNEVKSLNSEDSQATLLAEPECVSSELIGIGILMQKQNLEHNPPPLFTEPASFYSEPIRMNNIIDGQNSLKNDTVQDPQLELDNKTIGKADTSVPVGEAANINAVSSYIAPVTSLSVMMFEGEAIASEPKLGIEGSSFPRIVETQTYSSSANNDADSGIKEAIAQTRLDLSSGFNLSGSS